jgi:hypothetical protein
MIRIYGMYFIVSRRIFLARLLVVCILIIIFLCETRGGGDWGGVGMDLDGGAQCTGGGRRTVEQSASALFLARGRENT